MHKRGGSFIASGSSSFERQVSRQSSNLGNVRIQLMQAGISNLTPPNGGLVAKASPSPSRNSDTLHSPKLNALKGLRRDTLSKSPKRMRSRSKELTFSASNPLNEIERKQFGWLMNKLTAPNDKIEGC